MSQPSVFTRIISRELPAEIVFENERIIIIKDRKPDAPVHLLGITKQPYPSLDALLQDPTTPKDLLWDLFHALSEQAKKLGIAESGYRIVSNIGANAHQIVPHLHVHLLGGERLHMADPVE